METYLNWTQRCQVYLQSVWELKFTTHFNLTQHIPSKHSTQQGNLKQLIFNLYKESSTLVISVTIKLQHRVILKQNNLTKHTKSEPEGVSYDCNQCDSQAARQDRACKEDTTSVFFCCLPLPHCMINSSAANFPANSIWCPLSSVVQSCYILAAGWAVLLGVAASLLWTTALTRCDTFAKK